MKIPFKKVSEVKISKLQNHHCEDNVLLHWHPHRSREMTSEYMVCPLKLYYHTGRLYFISRGANDVYIYIHPCVCCLSSGTIYVAPWTTSRTSLWPMTVLAGAERMATLPYAWHDWRHFRHYLNVLMYNRVFPTLWSAIIEQTAETEVMKTSAISHRATSGLHLDVMAKGWVHVRR